MWQTWSSRRFFPHSGSLWASRRLVLLRRSENRGRRRGAHSETNSGTARSRHVKPAELTSFREFAGLRCPGYTDEGRGSRGGVRQFCRQQKHQQTSRWGEKNEDVSGKRGGQNWRKRKITKQKKMKKSPKCSDVWFGCFPQTSLSGLKIHSLHGTASTAACQIPGCCEDADWKLHLSKKINQKKSLWGTLSSVHASGDTKLCESVNPCFMATTITMPRQPPRPNFFFSKWNS